MANIMSLKNVRNKASRNGFDLSRRTCFTAKVGELLPVWWKYVLPGDSFTIDLKSFTRTQPVNTASFGRVREYYDFFFVPLEQLWNKSHTVLTQMNDNNQHAVGLNERNTLSGELPSMTTTSMALYIAAMQQQNRTNIFGFNRGNLTMKLLSYLGYGQIKQDDSDLVFASPAVSSCIFPLLAYQKIYSDFFRYSQWESPNPSTFNVDWMTGSGDTDITSTELLAGSNYNTFMDLRYCNYQKDLFHGVMPQAQFGSTAAVPLGAGSGSLDVSKIAISTPEGLAQNYVPVAPVGAPRGSYAVVTNRQAPVVDGTDGNPVNWEWKQTLPSSWANKNVVSDVSLDASSVSSLSILALRQAEALQRWKEVAQAAEEDYKQQIQAHWGVSVSDLLSGQCNYLGGINGSININEVVNTNLVSGAESQPADLAGKGIGAQNGVVTFNSTGQYGIIMCIYHALPLLDYITTGIEPTLLNVNASSFPIPEFDNIGMELLPSSVLSSNGLGSMQFSAYVPRYIAWKTDYDRCLGGFSVDLQSWILPYTDEMLKFTSSGTAEGDNNPNLPSNNYIRYPFFKVDPRTVDPMFAVAADSDVTTDCLLCQSFFDVKVTRNLDVNGLPY